MNLAELSTAEFWFRWIQIVILDLTLAGDNALVIALAVRKLPAKQQWQGRLWGTMGAVGLRIVFIAIISVLLRVPLLQAAGGAVLLWIAVKLLSQEGHGGGGASGPPGHDAPRGDLDHRRGRRGHEPRQRPGDLGRRARRHDRWSSSAWGSRSPS